MSESDDLGIDVYILGRVRISEDLDATRVTGARFGGRTDTRLRENELPSWLDPVIIGEAPTTFLQAAEIEAGNFLPPERGSQAVFSHRPEGLAAGDNVNLGSRHGPDEVGFAI